MLHSGSIALCSLRSHKIIRAGIRATLRAPVMKVSLDAHMVESIRISEVLADHPPFRRSVVAGSSFLIMLQIPFFMIKQSNDMISLIDGHDQRL